MKIFTHFILVLLITMSPDLFSNRPGDLRSKFRSAEAIPSFKYRSSNNQYPQVNGTDPNDTKWVRIESTSENWSVCVPADYLADISKGENRVYYRSKDLTIRITQNAYKNSKDRFKFDFSFKTPDEISKYSFFEIGEFIGSSSKSESIIPFKETYLVSFASKDRLTHISASSSARNSEAFLSFLQSIEIENKPLFKVTLPKMPESNKLSIDSLQTDESIRNALEIADSDQETYSSAEPKTGFVDTDRGKFDSPVLILRNPTPTFTELARKNKISGKSVFRVEFLSSGKIGKIMLVSSLDPGLDKNAFESAKRIKFLPAQLNGRPTDTIRTVSYEFTVY